MVFEALWLPFHACYLHLYTVESRKVIKFRSGREKKKEFPKLTLVCKVRRLNCYIVIWK